MTNRTTLRVPFEEKDQARALGARWDPNARLWWIAGDVDIAPFDRWSPQREGAPAPAFKSPAVRNLDFEQLEAQLEVPNLTAFFAPHLCWRCKQTSWLMDLWCHEDIDEPLGNDSDDAYFQMQATIDTSIWAEMIPALIAARTTLAIPATGTIKDRFHRTAGTDLFCQGCAHCDAPFGEFFNREFWTDFWTTRTPGDYTYKASLPWPVEEAIEAARELRAQDEEGQEATSD